MQSDCLIGAAAHGYYSRHGISDDRALTVLTPASDVEPWPLMVTFYPPLGCWMLEPSDDALKYRDELP